MKQLLIVPMILIISLSLNAQSGNVGIGTEFPTTKLTIDGAISLLPVAHIANQLITIEDDVSHFRITLLGGFQQNQLSMNLAREGQILYIINDDDNAATFSGYVIPPNGGVGSYIYTNSFWRPLVPSFTSWLMTGNNGTDPSINFIGTTDNQPLVFKTNGLFAGMLNPSLRNISFGGRSGSIFSNGFDNIFIGDSTGATASFGSYNTFLGSKAGANATIGDNNLFLGYSSGKYSTGSTSIAIGTNAGLHAAGSNNIFLGRETGVNTLNSFNVFIGEIAGKENTIGASNTFVGSNAGRNNTTGQENTMLGVAAGADHTTGDYNTYIGTLAGQHSIGASENTAIGYQAGKDNKHGDLNVFLGKNAGKGDSTGVGNVYLGQNTEKDIFGFLTDPVITNAVAIGANTKLAKSNTIILGNNATVGIGTNIPDSSAIMDIQSQNKGILIPRMTSANRIAIQNPKKGLLVFDNTENAIFFFNGSAWVNTLSGPFSWGLTGNTGTQAGTHFIGTTDNVPLLFKVNNQPFGQLNALEKTVSFGTRIPTIAGQSVFIGDSTGYLTLGGANTFVGYRSGRKTQYGGFNSFYGFESGLNTVNANNNSFFGGHSGLNNISGQHNSFFGNASGYNNRHGNSNTYIGYFSGGANIDGSSNVGIGSSLAASRSGNQNTAVGNHALEGVLQSINNTAIGYHAGARAIDDSVSINNTFLGYNAYGQNIEGDTLYNVTVLGAGAHAARSNAVILGNNANVGIGTSNPTSKLTVLGNVSISDTLILDNFDASPGDVLVCLDYSGKAIWSNGSDYWNGSEQDPQVNTTLPGAVPRWDGTSLMNGMMYDNGTNVGIGTASPNSSAILDLNASDKGLLIPRLSSSQRCNILNPANGLMVYDMDSLSLFIYGGSLVGWRSIQMNDGNLITVWYRDQDNDGYGDTAQELNSCSQPPGYVDIDGDCADTFPFDHPGAEEICDNRDNNCDGNVDETIDLLTDTENCGGCGIQCNYPNAASFCVSGVCQMGPCGSGFLDANNNSADGCEIDLQSGTHCYIEGVLYPNGQDNPSIECLVCNTTRSISNWSQKENAGQCLTDTTLIFNPTFGMLIYAIADSKYYFYNGQQWTDMTEDEIDPKVASSTSGSVPRWNGSALTDGVIQDDATNIGVGTAPVANQKLTVAGKTTTTNFQMTAGPQSGYVLRSDINGNGEWVHPDNLFINEHDPQTSMSVMHAVPRWQGVTLVDGLLLDDGSQLFTAAPFQTSNKITTHQLRITDGAGLGLVLQSNSDGNASWVDPNEIGYLETDPQVTTTLLNTIPRWNGSSLTNGLLFDNGDSLYSSSVLHIDNKLSVDEFALTTSVADGMILRSDASGNASWAWPSTLASGTLAEAYDFGGLGMGRTIFANHGALKIDGADGILITGSIGNGAEIELSGEGTRMLFNPRKGAFRAGHVTGAHWNSANVGLYSAAFGFSNTSSGARSFSAGEDNVASGFTSTVFGGGNTSSGDYSTSLGVSNTASGNTSIAIGTSNIASGTRAVSIGYFNTASEQVASAIGENNFAMGHASVALGRFNQANSMSEIVVGVKNNMINYTPSPTEWVETDRIFTVGNGNPEFTAPHSNAMVILKNGSVGIGNSFPSSKLEVNGKTTTTNLQVTMGAGNGFVLQSDPSGNATWVNSTSLSITESDPQVSSSITSKIPRWNGTALIDGVIQDDATNVGVGTAPVVNQKLTVAGKTTTTNLQMTTGANANFVLQSDASGNAAWVNANTLVTNNLYNTSGTLSAARTITQGSNAFTVLNNGSQNTIFNLSSTGDFDIQDNGVSALRVSDAGKVGINTTIPMAMLHVKDSSAVFTGGADVPLVPGAPPVNGTGVRMMWYADKAAFRVGRAGGTEWNKENVGLFSFAAGSQTKATGRSSFAHGEATKAFGDYACAFGFKNLATGEASTSLGAASVSRAYASLSIGQFNDSIATSSLTDWIPTDPVFIIGNGTSTDSRSNAMMVLKSGDTGIGATPVTGQKLTVGGKTTTTNLQMTNGAGANLVMQSDALGNASWVNSTSLTITESDPQVGSTSTSRVPRWNGTSLVDGVMQDDATNVGIGTAPVVNQKLTVSGKTTTTNLQMTTGAGANLVMQSDASGNASWVNVNTLNTNNLYNSNGTLTSARTLTQGSNALTILNNGTQNTILNLSSTGDFDIQDNGVSTFFVDNDGMTGINMNVPQAGLHIKGVEATFDAHLRLEAASSTDYANIVYDGSMKFKTFGADDEYQWRNSANNIGMTLQDDGDLGLGTSPSTKLHVNGALALDDVGNVEITADNQLVTVGNSSYLRISSNSSPAFNRTIELSNGLVIGQLLYIECNEATGDAFEIFDGAISNANTAGTISMGGGDMIQLMWNGTDWLQISYSNN